MSGQYTEDEVKQRERAAFRRGASARRRAEWLLLTGEERGDAGDPLVSESGSRIDLAPASVVASRAFPITRVRRREVQIGGETYHFADGKFWKWIGDGVWQPQYHVNASYLTEFLALKNCPTEVVTE